MYPHMYLSFRSIQLWIINDHPEQVNIIITTLLLPLGHISSNYVPIDFIVLDIDCNPTWPIILGRPFLRTIGAIIAMKERNIRF